MNATPTRRRETIVLGPDPAKPFECDHYLVDADYVNECVVGYEIRKVIYTEPGPVLYNQADSGITENPDRAEVLFSGSVRFDGCSNSHLDGECLHFCSKSEAVRFGELLGRVYDIVREMLPRYAADLS